MSGEIDERKNKEKIKRRKHNVKKINQCKIKR